MSIRFPDIRRDRYEADLAKKADWTPGVVAVGEVLRVPAAKQLLFAEQIDIEGEAVIDGDLVEVS